MQRREALEIRRQEAQERAEAREKRGDRTQLQHLEQRGFGECREAQRLRKRLEKPDESK